MRNMRFALLMLIGPVWFCGCGSPGVIELSIADTQRCHQVLAQEDALFSTAVSALDSYAANDPQSDSKLMQARAECKSFIDTVANPFVSDMFEKYQVSDKDYRLDIFRGSLVPLTAKEKAARDQALGSRLEAFIKTAGD